MINSAFFLHAVSHPEFETLYVNSMWYEINVCSFYIYLL